MMNRTTPAISMTRNASWINSIILLLLCLSGKGLRNQPKNPHTNMPKDIQQGVFIPPLP